VANVFSNRKTVGFLFDFFVEDYQAEILKGLRYEAKNQDINLICFCGGPLNSPEAHHHPRNAIYDLIHEDFLDGLIILGGTIGNFTNRERLMAFYRRFLHFPLVSIGTEIEFEDVPNILIDNTKGMRDVIEHVITIHGSRRIAFIRGTSGNVEAEMRYNIYKEVLEEHSIPFNSDLVCSGDFYVGSGIRAVSLLLDERKVSFDALVSSNDLMALEAMRELQKRGIDVPYDVIVTGFDDIEESRFARPALTTARQPLFDQGKKAIELIIAKLEGEKIDNKISLPAQLIIRRSCGCLTRKSGRAGLKKLQEADSSYNLNSKKTQKRLLNTLQNNISKVFRHPSWGMWLNDLISSLIKTLEENNEMHFIKKISQFIIFIRSRGAEELELHQIINALADELFRIFPEKHEFLRILINTATEVIWEYTMDQLFMQKKQSNEISRRLNIISIELITTFSIDRLLNVMRDQLPALGFNTFSIVEYTGKKSRTRYGHILLSLNEKELMHKLVKEREIHKSYELIPEILSQSRQRYSVLIMALYFKEEQLGFVLYDLTDLEGLVYETITIQLSSTLMGARLVKDIEDTQKEVLYTLGEVLESRSFETGNHVKQVADYSYLFSVKYGLDEEEAALIKHASPMHDIGKVGISDTILHKRGPLTEEEYEKVKLHTTIGYNILKSSDRRLLQTAAIIAYQHHERWDGTGYPRGLSGEDIHIYGRIVCLADVFDALGSDRSYRPKWPLDKILEYIKEQKNLMFEPRLVDILFDNLEEIIKIKSTFS
jgi:response regulator RpfG family c-di-GMP phosphodiesterase/DNA-binding LacI/PurR family transcriptional regulator